MELLKDLKTAAHMDWSIALSLKQLLFVSWSVYVVVVTFNNQVYYGISAAVEAGSIVVELDNEDT